jgi:hypothetical protein
MGAEIRAPAGKPFVVRLKAEVFSRSALRTVELIQNGKVIESAEATGQARTLRVEHEVPVESSSWFAARVTGAPARGIAGGGFLPRAHSGAIYVSVGGQPILLKDDVELMLRWIDRLAALLEERNNYGPGDNRARARAMITQAREHYQAKLARAR